MLHFALFLVVQSKIDLHRLCVARNHMRFDETLPFNDANLPEHSGFAAVGWTKPGKYPKLDSKSYWLNKVKSQDYPKPRMSDKLCFSKNESHTFTETCYKPVASSFWWGDSVKLSHRIFCVTEEYEFSLKSPQQSIFATHNSNFKHDSLLTHPNIPSPPSPWNLYHRLSSQISFQGTMPGNQSGFFWFKPLYWAVFYSANRISLNRTSTTSIHFHSTHIYPVSRQHTIEGIFGFQNSQISHHDYIKPEYISYYPIN
ncbi:hypothetical protein DSO57_1010912 [Entomophthora muscae]|uniref:Uncharacterized protein n=1 Tax=Entomophthora muscae TaxID=34485 RepID=A0ACC2U4N9_9FUNG|nr:hypothetical protein DSO57_1010912 [Entomophthora muscae]